MSTRQFSDNEAIQIWEELAAGKAVRDVAMKWEAGTDSIRRIWRGETYRHLKLGQGQRARAAGQEVEASVIGASLAALQARLAQEDRPKNPLEEPDSVDERVWPGRRD